MAKFEVVESRVWRNRQGRTVSVYGALPWYSETQRIAEGWEMVTTGFTVSNPITGQVGICRAPWQTREEAQAYADSHRPPAIGYGD